MSEAKDYYAILGVVREADEQAIKTAYRKLAFELHPDRTGRDGEKEERFKQVSEAFMVLGNAENRERYDLGLPMKKVSHSDADSERSAKEVEEAKKKEKEKREAAERESKFATESQAKIQAKLDAKAKAKVDEDAAVAEYLKGMKPGEGFFR